jgi:hypothetical protein
VYVILHEFAHHVHSQFLTSAKANAAWLKLFNTSIKVQTFKKEDVKALITSLLEGEEMPSDFKTSLDEQQRLCFNWAVRTIKQDSCVSVKELDTLFEAQEKGEIGKLWPSRTLHKKDLAPVISEYATVSYSETFAEAFAFYYCGKKLPAAVSSLVEKSVRLAKINQGKQP